MGIKKGHQTDTYTSGSWLIILKKHANLWLNIFVEMNPANKDVDNKWMSQE